MDHYQLGSVPFWATFLTATLLYRTYRGALFFLAAFPGTLAHELAHYLTALVLRGRPNPINLVPRKTPDGGWTLGSVSFYPNHWNGSFVALAPLILLPVAWLVATHAAQLTAVHQLWLGYLVGCMVNSSLPSKPDWEVVTEYPLGFFLLLLAGAAWQLHRA